jgi:hypothetical protein
VIGMLRFIHRLIAAEIQALAAQRALTTFGGGEFPED